MNRISTGAVGSGMTCPSGNRYSACRVGGELLALAKQILHMRKRVRDGTLSWPTFQRRMPPHLQPAVVSVDLRA
ncbi:MAG: hypothetical protein WC975_15575 [Phycisphaerae bacterium]